MSDDHPSLDELAELDEGLLPPDRASDLRAHVDACAQCRAGADGITTTRMRLAALPPVTMPADVAARLDRAMAEASPQTATVVPNIAAMRQRRFGRPTMAASAAAAAIVLAFGAIVVAHLMGTTTAHSTEDAGSAAGGAALAPAAIVPPQPQNYVQTSTGLNYTPSRLISDVPGLIPGNRFPAATTSGTFGAPQAQPSGAESLTKQPVPASLRPLYNSRAKLLRCAAYLSQIPNAVPLAVDFGRWTNATYQKAPSVILIMRDSDPRVVDVYVTGPTCFGVGAVRTYVKVPVN